MTDIVVTEVHSTAHGDRPPKQVPGSALQQRVAAIEQMGASDLRQEWRRLFRADPPPLSRDLVLRALAYRVQEIEHGGMSKATLRQLSTVARGLRSADGDVRERAVEIRPGARLVREWRGRTHTVTATEAGFDYAGHSFASLTQIAKTITGAHWSGPRFFGLVKKSLEALHPATEARCPSLSTRPQQEEVRHG